MIDERFANVATSKIFSSMKLVMFNNCSLGTFWPMATAMTVMSLD